MTQLLSIFDMIASTTWTMLLFFSHRASHLHS